MKKLIVAVFLVALPVAAADSMPVSTFLEKADALKAKGMLALFSGDYKLLKNEVTQAGDALHAERLAAKASGRRPAYCPPNDQGAINVNELLTAFHTIPAAKQPRTEVKDALRALLARKYPCSA